MRIRILVFAALMVLSLGAATAPIAPDKNASPPTETQIQVADLKAQQSMAMSARTMIMPTYLQLILGLVGALGLFATLYYTRKSLELTRESLKLTQTEVANQSDASKKQLRAYVGVKLTHVRSLNEGLASLQICISNKGASPAKEVMILTVWSIGPTPVLAPYFNGSSGPWTIGANDQMEMDIPFERSLTKGERVGLAMPTQVPKEGLLFLIVGAQVSYADVFGDVHITSMAWTVRADATGTILPQHCTST
ncbi:hypothetical protein D3C72_659040 [compost metagenome]